MKMQNLIILTAVFACMAAMAGCSGHETYGERISGSGITPIKDILIRPEGYNGKAVVVKGRIATECSTGCWFDLKEGGAVIYVDVEPSGFAIPQKVGRLATIEGTVMLKNGKPTLIGKGVKIE